VDTNACNESDLMNRRKTVVNNVDKIGYKFLKLKNIVNGNLKLNLAFVANSFNSYPALDPMKFEEVVEKMHEEKSFHNWMNSLGAKPYLNHLDLWTESQSTNLGST